MLIAGILALILRNMLDGCAKYVLVKLTMLTYLSSSLPERGIRGTTYPSASFRGTTNIIIAKTSTKALREH